MVHNVGDVVWSFISPLEPPKKCKVLDIQTIINNVGNSQKVYILRHKKHDFDMKPHYVFSNKIEAEIHWAICFQQAYENTVNNLKMLDSHDYDKSKLLADRILRRYSDTYPELLVKYL